MSETILAVITGGVLGIISTIITLVAQARADRHKQQRALMESHINKLVKSMELLLDVEDVLSDRVRVHEAIAKKYLKKEIRDAIGGEGISGSIVTRGELVKINASVPAIKIKGTTIKKNPRSLGKVGNRFDRRTEFRIMNDKNSI